jgi:hypothetical protein
MAFTKAHARILSAELSELAANTLKKMFSGQSYMAQASVWEELIDRKLVWWSNAEKYALTATGKKVAAKI